MDELIKHIIEKLDLLQKTKRITTGEVRKISAKIYNKIHDESFKRVRKTLNYECS